MSIKLQKISEDEELREDMPLQWKPTKGLVTGLKVAKIVCANGHFVSVGLEHKISKKGKVNRAVSCPYCDFEEEIILVGWDG